MASTRAVTSPQPPSSDHGSRPWPILASPRSPAATATGATRKPSTAPACPPSPSSRTRWTTKPAPYHSNLDTFERLSEPDLKQAAVVEASLLFDAAQRDAMLPRKPVPTSRTRRCRCTPTGTAPVRERAYSGHRACAGFGTLQHLCKPLRRTSLSASLALLRPSVSMLIFRARRGRSILYKRSIGPFAHGNEEQGDLVCQRA